MTWIVVCEGPTLKGYEDITRELVGKYKEHSIGVNFAPIAFDTKYWAFCDNGCWRPVLANIKPYQKVVCSFGTRYGNPRFRGEPAGVMREYTECSGNMAIAWAIRQGAKNIITIGHDLTKDWQHYNGRPGKIQTDPYIKNVRRRFEELKQKGNIYSLNPQNTLGLPVWKY